MRKAILTACMILLASLAVCAADPSLPAAATVKQPASLVSVQTRPDRTLTVPAETEAAVELLSGIHSQISRVGDPITAQLLQPVYVDGEVALPRGSVLDGHITRIRRAGRFRRSAELAFRFETITLPDGQAAPIAAMLTGLENAKALRVQVDSEGQLKGARRFPWRVFTGGLVGLGAFTGLEAGLVGATALTAALPAGGGAALAYAFLWSRGDEVHIPPDTCFHIRLHDSLTVRANW
jgi:hypothetical protein